MERVDKEDYKYTQMGGKIRVRGKGMSARIFREILLDYFGNNLYFVT